MLLRTHDDRHIRRRKNNLILDILEHSETVTMFADGALPLKLSFDNSVLTRYKHLQYVWGRELQSEWRTLASTRVPIPNMHSSGGGGGGGRSLRGSKVKSHGKRMRFTLYPVRDCVISLLPPLAYVVYEPFGPFNAAEAPRFVPGAVNRSQLAPARRSLPP